MSRSPDQSPITRSIAFLAAATMLLEVTGCGGVPALSSDDRDRPSISPPQQSSARISELSPKHGLKTVLDTAPGVIWLDIESPCPSGGTNRKSLAFRAEADQHYLVLAYEPKRGLSSASVTRGSSQQSSGFSMAGLLGGGGGPGGGLLFLIGLLWDLGAHVVRSDTSANVSEGCSSIWIEDVESGEIVAGASPWPLASLR